MPSHKMFAVLKKVDGRNVYLARDGKSWTTNYREIMFYAYAAYADDRARRHPGATVGECTRDYDVCAYGGEQKRKRKRTQHRVQADVLPRSA